MASLQTHNDIIARRTNGDYGSVEPIHGWFTATRNSILNNNMATNRGFFAPVRPTLETGVTAHIPVQVQGGASLLGVMITYCQMINLGSLDISGASGTFTPGSTMGTTTFGGQTINRSGPVFAEVTTALNSAPGSITITYVDAAGNTAETTTSTALTASSPVGSGTLVRLNNPDGAAREITAAARSAGTTPTGVIKFWGLIPIGSVITNGGSGAFSMDLFNKRPMTRLLGATETGGIIFSATAVGVEGSISFVGDQA